jgi:hypothetical protein
MAHVAGFAKLEGPPGGGIGPLPVVDAMDMPLGSPWQLSGTTKLSDCPTGVSPHAVSAVMDHV